MGATGHSSTEEVGPSVRHSAATARTPAGAALTAFPAAEAARPLIGRCRARIDHLLIGPPAVVVTGRTGTDLHDRTQTVLLVTGPGEPPAIDPRLPVLRRTLRELDSTDVQHEMTDRRTGVIRTAVVPPIAQVPMGPGPARRTVPNAVVSRGIVRGMPPVPAELAAAATVSDRRTGGPPSEGSVPAAAPGIAEPKTDRRAATVLGSTAEIEEKRQVAARDANRARAKGRSRIAPLGSATARPTIAVRAPATDRRSVVGHRVPRIERRAPTSGRRAPTSDRMGQIAVRERSAPGPTAPAAAGIVRPTRIGSLVRAIGRAIRASREKGSVPAPSVTGGLPVRATGRPTADRRAKVIVSPMVGRGRMAIGRVPIAPTGRPVVRRSTGIRSHATGTSTGRARARVRCARHRTSAAI